MTRCIKSNNSPMGNPTDFHAVGHGVYPTEFTFTAVSKHTYLFKAQSELWIWK